MGRLKALAVLSLPLLIFAVIVFLGSSLRSRFGTTDESRVAQPSAEATSVTVQPGPVPKNGETATGTHPNVTTYVITGSY